ncbi:MAG TPA: glycosyltransferase [Candidatus Acidoferrales bacterium]|nr:glycosyltransferase [Candidatus Acidoferrales bacterium]
MTRPTVTALIDTYNHERFIEEAIVSVLEQDFPQTEMEVIVVDDGSTDRTPDIIRKFVPRVRHLRKENGGQASAFNVGIPEAKGQMVAFLDGDDWWLKTKLRRVLDTIARRSDIGFVGHGNILTHQHGGMIRETLREGHRFRANTLEGALLFRVRKNFLGTSRMTIRTSLLRNIGRVPEELRIQADEYLFTLAAVLCEVEILPDALTFYRLHDSNLFMVNRHHPERVRAKQVVLDALSKRLGEQLVLLDINAEAIRAIIEGVQVEADQLKLMLDGGFPWETVQVEYRIHRILSSDATRGQRVLRYARILSALVLPPRFYYRVQRRIAHSPSYQRARAKYLPIPEPTHVERESAVAQGMSSK